MRYELNKWHKQVVGIEPNEDDPDLQVRWTIAHMLATGYDNAQTAAHLITGLRWDKEDHRPSLRIASWIVQAVAEELPTEEQFIERLRCLF